MSYATPQDMRAAFPEDRLVQLTDRRGMEAIDDARLAAALREASVEIDGYLAARHVTPVAPAPEILKLAALDIAFYRLYAAQSPTVIEDVRKRYEDRVAYLTRIAQGVFDLPGGAEPGAEPAGPAGHGDARFSAPGRVFGRAGLAGF